MTKSELNFLISSIKKVEIKKMVFSTGTGGVPEYNNELEKDIIEKGETFQYETSQNGNAYSGWIKITCGKTEFVDYHGDIIYISKSGFIFTEDYREGSPANFDKCILDKPDIRINLKDFDINEYIKIQDILKRDN